MGNINAHQAPLAICLRVFAAIVLPSLTGCSSGASIVSLPHGTSNGSAARASELKASHSILDHSRATTRGLSGSEYERIGEALDNPEQLFQRANYTPLWTSSENEAAGHLPTGCTVIPHESRSWEPWFRQTLKNGDKVLSTGDLLMLRDNLVLAVARDQRTRFNPSINAPGGDLVGYWSAKLDEVRKEVLREFGVDRPSSALVQVTMADAATAFVRTQRHYGQDLSDKYFRAKRVWPTGNQLLDNNLGMSCQEATSVVMFFIRRMEKENVAAHAPTGIQAGGTYLSSHRGGEGAHGVTGVRISLGSGSFANLYYDGTPVGPFGQSAVDILATFFGAMDQVSMEQFANTNSMYLLDDDPLRMGAKPTVPDGRFSDGENWRCFYLGNYVPYPKKGQAVTGGQIGPDGKRESPKHRKMRLAKEPHDFAHGWEPFEKYYKQNVESITLLEKTLHDVLAGHN